MANTVNDVPAQVIVSLHDALGHQGELGLGCSVCERVLWAVPEGWAKLDGEWVYVVARPAVP